jgi:hypothetical protein
LNCFSPSMPIFKPKSDICGHLLENIFLRGLKNDKIYDILLKYSSHNKFWRLVKCLSGKFQKIQH